MRSFSVSADRWTISRHRPRYLDEDSQWRQYATVAANSSSASSIGHERSATSSPNLSRANTAHSPSLSLNSERTSRPSASRVVLDVRVRDSDGDSKTARSRCMLRTWSCLP